MINKSLNVNEEQCIIKLFLIEHFFHINEIDFWKIFKIKILFISIQVLAIYIWCSTCYCIAYLYAYHKFLYVLNYWYYKVITCRKYIFRWETSMYIHTSREYPWCILQFNQKFNNVMILIFNNIKLKISAYK